jgi:acylphosphatase
LRSSFEVAGDATRRRLLEGSGGTGLRPKLAPKKHRASVPRIRRQAIIHGRVQGVFFRDTTRRLAVSRGVAGWVRNRPDGTVEAVFEGEPEAVEAMVAFCREGPRGAQVDRVEVSEEKPEGLAGFAVR